MASKATNKKSKKSHEQRQREALGLINAANSALDTFDANAKDVLDILERDSLAISFSPFEYLFKLLKLFGITDEEIKEIIIDILTVLLPTLEVTVKASILKNIKTIVNCNLDPRIPDEYRMAHGDGYFTPRSITNLIRHNQTETKGLFISVDAIDPTYMLGLSPYTDGGKELYFGQYKDGNPCSPYQLARADDMNAFLWFCVHKGQFPSPTLLNLTGITANNSTVNIGNKNYAITNGRTLLDCLTLEGIDSKPMSINVGNTFSSVNNRNLLSVAIDVEEDNVRIVPASSDWNSCNWYVDRSKYFTRNLSSNSSVEREYEKEFGLFNIQYLKPSDYGDRYGKLNGLNNIKLCILPKPYTLLPTFVKEKTGKSNIRWAFAKILFNASGQVDKSGKYTINYNPNTFLESEAIAIDDYLLIPYNDSDDWFYFVDTNTYGFAKVNDGSVTIVNDPAVYEKHLVECYPGITLYEFNYDFVMGMRLFDPVVVTRRMLNAMFSPAGYVSVNVNLNLKGNRGGNSRANNSSYANIKSRVELMVKKLIEGDEEISDCYYRFTNDEYEQLLAESAAARYNEQPYRTWNAATSEADMTEIDRILNGYSDTSTLQEQKTTIRTAFETAEKMAVDLSSEVISSNGSTTQSQQNRSAVSTQFWFDLCSTLKEVLVEAIVTPKLLMLLEINNQMFYNNDTGGSSLNAQALTNAISNIITAVIRELLDMIAQKLLNYILSRLTVMLADLAKKIGEEQIKGYLRVLRSLLSLFRRGFAMFNQYSQMISSKLNGGNYFEYNQGASSLLNSTISQMNSDYYNYLDNDDEDDLVLSNC